MPFPGTLQASGNKIDVTKLQNFNGFNTSVALGTSYVPLLSITGKGFLRNAVVAGQVNTSLRVTIDGILKFEGTSSTTSGTGVILFDDMQNSATNGLGLMIPGTPSTVSTFPASLVNYPYTANAVSAVTVLAFPIYFYSSLLLEYKGSSAENASYYYSGGYQ